MSFTLNVEKESERESKRESITSQQTHLMAWTAGRDFGLANLRFNCDGSVTYFSAFCRRRRKPACIIFSGWE